MNFSKETLPMTLLENKDIQLFNNFEDLGFYVFVQMIAQTDYHNIRHVTDKIIEKFNVDEDYILNKYKMISSLGLLFKYIGGHIMFPPGNYKVE